MPSIEIADKTTLDAVNTKVGTNADAAGTSTLFARLEQLADLINNVSPTTPQIADLYVAEATRDTYYTACNISGRGLLSRVVINAATLKSDKVAIQVTIDGGTPIVFSWTDAVQSRYDFSGKGAQIHFPNTLFKSSLKVEGKHTNSSTTDLEVSVDYGLF